MIEIKYSKSTAGIDNFFDFDNVQEYIPMSLSELRTDGSILKFYLSLFKKFDIIDKNATTRINGYQPSIDAEQIAYFGDECFDFVDDIRYNMKTGDEATTQILLVDKYKEVSEGSFRAQVFDCTISINSDGGPADDDSKVNYTIDINGDPINGTVAIANGVPTFTKAASA